MQAFKMDVNNLKYSYEDGHIALFRDSGLEERAKATASRDYSVVMSSLAVGLLFIRNVMIRYQHFSSGLELAINMCKLLHGFHVEYYMWKGSPYANERVSNKLEAILADINYEVLSDVTFTFDLVIDWSIDGCPEVRYPLFNNMRFWEPP